MCPASVRMVKSAMLSFFGSNNDSDDSEYQNRRENFESQPQQGDRDCTDNDVAKQAEYNSKKVPCNMEEQLDYLKEQYHT